MSSRILPLPPPPHTSFPPAPSPYHPTLLPTPPSLQGGLKVLQIKRRWQESLFGGGASFHVRIAAHCDVGIMLAIAAALDDYEREVR